VRELDLQQRLRDMPDDELEATRRDLATGLGLMTPGNGMYAQAHTFLNAVDTELAQRQRRASGQPSVPEAS
jgi:hypothetical protein